MPLPKQLHELLSSSHPEMVKLSTDQRLQLKAYVTKPDKISMSIRRLRDDAHNESFAAQRELTERRQFLEYLKRVLTYNELLSDSTQPNQPQNSRKGRPRDSDPKDDQRTYEAWASKRYKTHNELAHALNKPVKEVKRALDRHRKRVHSSE